MSSSAKFHTMAMVGRVSALAILIISSVALLLCFDPIVSLANVGDNNSQSQFFSQTKHTVVGKFLDYWQTNGGLTTFGYPISEAANEVDPETGHTFLTQWFERNRFELHPENAGTPYEVELGLLGKDLRREALSVDLDFQRTSARYDPSVPKEMQWYFNETGHNLNSGFLDYWLKNGGLARFGYPISEVHGEVDPESGNVFQMQWFERARFEYHPENKPPYDILLGLLGNQLKNPKQGLEFTWKIGNKYNLFAWPLGIATDSQDNLFVVNGKTYEILKYNAEDNLLARWNCRNKDVGIQDDMFPFRLTVNKQGNVFVTNHAYHWVEKYDNYGKFLTKWGDEGEDEGQFVNINDITVDNQGNVFVSDVGIGQIQKFDNNGQFLTRWKGKNRALGPTSNKSAPYGVAVDSQGNVFITDVANNQVQKFDNNGNFLTAWGEEGSADGQFMNPTDVVVDNQDNVWILDTNNKRVEKFDNTGSFLGKWISNVTGVSDFSFFFSIAVDRQGNLFGSDFIKDQIVKFDKEGKFLTKWSSSIEGQFNTPAAIRVDKQGNLFVVDIGNARIQKFDNSGKFIASWVNSSIENRYYSPSGITVDSQGKVYMAQVKYKNMIATVPYFLNGVAMVRVMVISILLQV